MQHSSFVSRNLATLPIPVGAFDGRVENFGDCLNKDKVYPSIPCIHPPFIEEESTSGPRSYKGLKRRVHNCGLKVS